MADEDAVVDAVEEQLQTEPQTDIEAIINSRIEELFSPDGEAHERLKSNPSYNKFLQRSMSRAETQARENIRQEMETNARQRIEDDHDTRYWQYLQKNEPQTWSQMQRDPEQSQRIRDVNLRLAGINPTSYTKGMAVKEIGENIVGRFKADERLKGLTEDDIMGTPIDELPFLMGKKIAENQMTEERKVLKAEMLEEFEAMFTQRMSSEHANAEQPSEPPGSALVQEGELSNDEILRRYNDGDDSLKQRAFDIINKL